MQTAEHWSKLQQYRRPAFTTRMKTITSSDRTDARRNPTLTQVKREHLRPPRGPGTPTGDDADGLQMLPMSSIDERGTSSLRDGLSRHGTDLEIFRPTGPRQPSGTPMRPISRTPPNGRNRCSECARQPSRTLPPPTLRSPEGPQTAGFASAPMRNRRASPRAPDSEEPEHAKPRRLNPMGRSPKRCQPPHGSTSPQRSTVRPPKEPPGRTQQLGTTTFLRAATAARSL